MKTRAPFILFHALVILLSAVSECYCQRDAYFNEQRIQQIGQTFSKWFYASELDSLSTAIVNQEFTLSQLRDFRAQVERECGHEQAVLSEQTGTTPNHYYYIRYSRFENAVQPVRTTFAFMDAEHIYQFSVQVLPQEAQTRFSDYQTKTELHVPFKGEWYVAWGGHSIHENQHAVSSPQRFACDFLIRRDGRTFKTDGSINTDYHCFAQEIFAPGSGVIVDVVNDIDDNVPGEKQPLYGNRVVIDHGNGEYSFLIHFMKGSIAVDTNDRIETGQFLGLCGNSGQSSESHLHYHLQNSSDIDTGEGLPVQFQSFVSDGILISRGEPHRGAYIRNPDQ